MNAKHMMSTALLALILPFGAYAGDDHKHKHKDKSPEEMAERISEKLDLDDGRTEEMRQIFQWYSDEKDQLKEDKKQRIEAVLTESELEQLKEMKEKKKDKHKRRDKDKDDS